MCFELRFRAVTRFGGGTSKIDHVHLSEILILRNSLRLIWKFKSYISLQMSSRYLMIMELFTWGNLYNIASFIYKGRFHWFMTVNSLWGPGGWKWKQSLSLLAWTPSRSYRGEHHKQSLLAHLLFLENHLCRAVGCEAHEEADAYPGDHLLHPEGQLLRKPQRWADLPVLEMSLTYLLGRSVETIEAHVPRRYTKMLITDL